MCDFLFLFNFQNGLSLSAQIFPVSVMNQLDVDLFLGNCVNLSKESMKNFLKLLKFIFMEAGEDSSQNHVIQGTLLAQLILKKMKLLEDLLTKHVDVKFNRKALYLCEQEIRQKNPSRVPLVRRLRSINSERSILSKEDLSVEEENKYLSHLQAENIPCRPFLTKRILHHMKTKNAERVSELLALFDELKLQHSPLMFANLLAMYVTAGDIEKAREALNKLQTEFPDFNLDLAKLLDYATNLIKYEKFDESYEVLKNLLKEPYSYSSKEKVYICLRSFITQLSNVNDIELVRKMQNLIFPLSKELGFKKLLLEPAINYHLQRNDLKSAVEEFRNTIMKHRTPCCLGPIFRKCLKIDDKNTLQRVVDLAMGCSGKSYVLLELAVACIENNDIQKAVNVIESLGSETDPRDLDGICNRLSLQNKLNELEQLIYITKSLDHVDREDLYMHAFRACDIKNDLERAKKLFHSLQKEVEKPKPEILSFVENMLKIPRQSDTAIPSPASPEIESFAAETTKTFIEQVKAGNAATALSELNALKKGYIRTLPLKTMTDLMDLCLQQNCTTDLSANVQAMSYIIENGKDILHPLLVKYSEAGDVEKFSTISSFMPDFCLMKCSFNTYFCKAYITSGQYENLLAELEQRSDKKNKMYSTIAFEELLKFPQFEDRVFNLALKYMDASYNTPMAIVWSHYFIKEDFEKAEEIFKKYPVQIERTDAVIRSIRENENIPLALRYVDFIKNTSARQRVKERAFGAALDLLVSKEKYDEAVALVVESEKMNLLLYKYYVKPLITLKNVLEKQNKPIPFTVPQDSSSDSK